MFLKSRFKNRDMVVCEIDNGQFNDIYSLLADPNCVLRDPNLFLTSDELDKPYLITETGTIFTEVFDILIKENDESVNAMIDNIYEALKADFPFSKEEYMFMYKGIKSLESYFASDDKIEINFPIENYENFSATSELVNRIKKTSGTFSVANNKTIPRKKFDDELFIMVPSSDSLVLADEITQFIPNMKNVFVPFEDPELYTHNYKNALKAHGMSMEDIFGDPNNNKFELYPEEERYYEALVALHNALMEREHPNNTLEDCIKYNEYSDLFKTYIGYMTVEALRYHRNHSGFISLNSYSNDEGDDDNDDKEDKVSGDELSINLFYASGRKGNFDGEEVILSLVEDQIKQDCYAPINLLIQALRFGKRLPSRLQLSNGRYFDLKDFSYSNLSGSFSSYVVQQTELGNNYSVIGLVKCSNRILDSEYVRSVNFTKSKLDCPVGLILSKSFVDSEEKQSMLISFVDLVRFLPLDSSLTIDGVSIVNGKVMIDEDIVPNELLDNAKSLDEVVGRLNYPSFIGYVNPVMKGDFMECNAFNNSIHPLGILRDSLTSNNLKNLNVFVSVSKDDVLDKVRTYRLGMEYILRCTVTYYMLDLTVQADKFIDDLAMQSFSYTISDVISIYQSIVNSSDYPLGVYTSDYGDYSPNKVVNGEVNNNNSVVDNSNANSDTNSTIDNNANTINSSNAFGSQSTQTVQDVNYTSVNEQPSVEKANTDSIISDELVIEEESNKNVINIDSIYYNGKVENLVTILVPTELVNKINSIYKELGNDDFQIKSFGIDGANTIIGYLTVVNKRYILLDPKKYEIAPVKKVLFSKLSSRIVGLLRTVISGKEPIIKFSSEEALNYYFKIVEKM